LYNVRRDPLAGGQGGLGTPGREGKPVDPVRCARTTAGRFRTGRCGSKELLIESSSSSSHAIVRPRFAMEDAKIKP